MHRLVLLPLACALLCGCAPDTNDRTTAAAAESKPAVTFPASATAARAEEEPSYEVSIASAAADRVHALDQCNSKAKAERSPCVQTADAEYDQAKSAAESKRKGAR